MTQTETAKEPEMLDDGTTTTSAEPREGAALPPLVDTETVARMTGYSKKQICRYLKEGKLRGAKIGRVWRVNTHDLMEKFGLD